MRNIGYRLGLHTRRLMGRFNRWETKMQQRGVPRWLTKLPLLLCIAAVAGLFIIGAIFIASFLLLMLLIAWGMVAIAKGKGYSESESYDSTLSGYNIGPEGPGMYMNGKKIRHMDDDDY